jgi:hypothetical protein
MAEAIGYLIVVMLGIFLAGMFAAGCMMVLAPVLGLFAILFGRK